MSDEVELVLGGRMLNTLKRPVPSSGAWTALAVSGKNLCGRWKAKKPTNVFLFDTEMHRSTIEERLKAEFLNHGFDDIPDNNIQILNRTANAEAFLTFVTRATEKSYPLSSLGPN